MSSCHSYEPMWYMHHLTHSSQWDHDSDYFNMLFTNKIIVNIMKFIIWCRWGSSFCVLTLGMAALQTRRFEAKPQSHQKIYMWNGCRWCYLKAKEWASQDGRRWWLLKKWNQSENVKKGNKEKQRKYDSKRYKRKLINTNSEELLKLKTQVRD